MVALRVHLKGRRPSSDGASPLEPTCCFRDSEKWPFKILESKGMGPLQSLEKSMLCSENRQQVRFQDAMLLVNSESYSTVHLWVLSSGEWTCSKRPAVMGVFYVLYCPGHA